MPSPVFRAIRVVEPEVAYQQALDAGLIVHRAHPLNAETPLSALTGQAVISSGRFYIRNHFHIPDLDPATWRLRVSGLVERPFVRSRPTAVHGGTNRDSHPGMRRQRPIHA